MAIIRLENIPRFKNWTFSKDRILLSKVGNLDESEINKRLQSKQALNPYNKNFGKINSATVQTINFINGPYNPSTVLGKLIRDKTNSQIQNDYDKILEDNPYFNSYDDLIIAFAREHNDTVITTDKNERKSLQNVLDQSSYNKAINIKQVDLFDRSNIQTLTSESAFSNEQQVTSNVLPFQIYQKEDFIDTVETSIMEAKIAGDPDPRRKKDDSTWNKLSQKTRDIIDGLGIDEIAPNWFINNNVNWLLNGEITEQEFLNSYRNLVDSGVIIPFPTTPTPPEPTPPEPTPPEPTPPEPTPPEPTPPDDDLVSYPTITQNMVNQDFNDFQMFDNKIIGSITYKATKHFNPHYFYDFKSNIGSKLTALLIVEDEKHVSILEKLNELRFSDIERDELINFDITIPNDVNFVYLKTMVYLNIDDSRPFSNVQAIELGVNRPYFEKKRDSLIGSAIGVLLGSLTLTLLTTKR